MAEKQGDNVERKIKQEEQENVKEREKEERKHPFSLSVQIKAAEQANQLAVQVRLQGVSKVCSDTQHFILLQANLN